MHGAIVSGNDTGSESTHVLRLDHYGIRFRNRTILSDISFSLAEQSVTCLLGPAGTGKSTLLRTLCGLNENNPNLRTWGQVTYCGEPLRGSNRPVLLMQNTQLMTASVMQNVLLNIPERASLDLSQQRDLAIRLLENASLAGLISKLHRPVSELSFYENRHLSIARICAANPPMICLDEPTTGLNVTEVNALLEYVLKQSQKRTVLVVLHNQNQWKKLPGDILLMAGGVIQEKAPVTEFFQNPKTTAGNSFTRTGSCSVPSPDLALEDRAEDCSEPELTPDIERSAISDSFGPRGFMWLIKGRLAGSPMPGVFYETEYDLKALQRVGVNYLISLTDHSQKEPPLDLDLLKHYGIQNYHSPVQDMEAPSLEDTVRLCQLIDSLMNKNRVTAVHCRAGMGRTGTVLTCYLIWQGASAMQALEQARSIEPRWVQSESQVKFLEQFESALQQQTF